MFSKLKRALTTFATPPLRFVGAQDGPAERRLMQTLAVLLRDDPAVARAYLTRVVYDGAAEGVMLAVSHEGPEDDDLVRRIGDTFAAQFNASAHLDVLFLSAEQETAVAAVCPAFYRRG